VAVALTRAHRWVARGSQYPRPGPTTPQNQQSEAFHNGPDRPTARASSRQSRTFAERLVLVEGPTCWRRGPRTRVIGRVAAPAPARSTSPMLPWLYPASMTTEPGLIHSPRMSRVDRRPRPPCRTTSGRPRSWMAAQSSPSLTTRLARTDKFTDKNRGLLTSCVTTDSWSRRAVWCVRPR
jgi:hypothetical protein